MTNEHNSQHDVQAAKEVKTFPATVVEITDPYTLAINRGSIHGIKKGQTFLIYGLSEKEIIDPETKENLGHLEIVRGSGVVVNVQDRLALIESNRRSKTKRIITRKPRSYFSLGTGLEETESIEGEGTLLAFDDPEVGDKARPV